MKNLRLPAIVMGALVMGFLFLLWTANHILPYRVASHFDPSGNADGWIGRREFVLLAGGIGLVMPLLFGVLFLIIQFAPGLLLARAAQKEGEAGSGMTFNYLMRRSFWFASMTLCFIAAVQTLIMEANFASPPRLQMSTLLVVVSGFVVGVLFWSASLFYHFLRGRRLAQQPA